jgi:hypothetical protein
VETGIVGDRAAGAGGLSGSADRADFREDARGMANNWVIRESRAGE